MKFPKLIQSESINISEVVKKVFFNEDLKIIFNGKNAVEEIYADLLAKNFDLNAINELFKQLSINNLLVDKVNLESNILSDEDLDIYNVQISTLSFFNQQYSESKYLNLTAGLISQEKINRFPISIIGKSLLNDELFVKIKKLGVKNVYQNPDIHNLPGPIGLLIYVPDEYLETEIIKITQYCNSTNVVFFPIIKTNFGIEFGPIQVPNDTSCYMCLINRKKSVLGEGYETIYKEILNFNFSIGGDFALLEVLKYISGIAPISLRNRILQHNFITGAFTFHPVLKIPGCSICGNDFKPRRKLWEEIV